MNGYHHIEDFLLTSFSLDYGVQRLRKVFWPSVVADMDDENQ
ncbi:hypothetical protein IQ31_04877 [Sphingobacterium siyangense]|jgi:hypothetical protein|uniref:Uncharacterized protein n=1 Tax=Sphingobacterium siyangense TaxID=459529 RepID=A0A562M722_9SPHI|nr:hypothetical protein IQ31_04877 [Sphingobacterium siyangense]